METLRITLRPETAFGSPIKGDTLFGQSCWMIREAWGEPRLQRCLQDYINNQPFLICSDAFPHGHILRPEYPLSIYDSVAMDRKQLKKLRWLSLIDLNKPVTSWLSYFKSDQDLFADGNYSLNYLQQHNSINRLTGTTGNDFAPYQMEQIWYGSLLLDIWFLYDRTRINRQEVLETIERIGQIGYGRDASIGLGKFTVASTSDEQLYQSEQVNNCITLAPAILSGQNFNPEETYYSLFTRFGRHGVQNLASGKPFKNPVLMADTAAVLSTDKPPATSYIGKGLGTDGKLSKAQPNTVQQGYAPCIKLHFEGIRT